MARIADLMVTEMIMVTPHETVAEAVRRMSHNKVGAVIIVEDQSLWGLFSERDLVNRVVRENRDPQMTGVGDVATRELVTIDVNASLKEVLRILRQNKFRHLPVLRSGRPVGILSTRDFFEHLVDGLERYIDEWKYKCDLAAGLDPYDHLGGAYER